MHFFKVLYKQLKYPWIKFFNFLFISLNFVFETLISKNISKSPLTSIKFKFILIKMSFLLSFPAILIFFILIIVEIIILLFVLILMPLVFFYESMKTIVEFVFYPIHKFIIISFSSIIIFYLWQLIKYTESPNLINLCFSLIGAFLGFILTLFIIDYYHDFQKRKNLI